MTTGLRRVAMAGVLFALVMAVGTVDVAAQTHEEYEKILRSSGTETARS